MRYRMGVPASARGTRVVSVVMIVGVGAVHAGGSVVVC